MFTPNENTCMKKLQGYKKNIFKKYFPSTVRAGGHGGGEDSAALPAGHQEPGAGRPVLLIRHTALVH